LEPNLPEWLAIGKTIDFMLSENRDMPAAKRFFIKELSWLRDDFSNANKVLLYDFRSNTI